MIVYHPFRTDPTISGKEDNNSLLKSIHKCNQCGSNDRIQD